MYMIGTSFSFPLLCILLVTIQNKLFYMHNKLNRCVTLYMDLATIYDYSVSRILCKSHPQSLQLQNA